MRRLAMTALLLTLATSTSSWAQRPAPVPAAPVASTAATSAAAEPGTKFERFVLRRGAVVAREFHRVSILKNSEWTVVRGYIPGTKESIIAVRVEVSKYDSLARSSRTRSGFMDAEELLSLRDAYAGLEKMFQALPTEPYTEVEFRGGGVRVGFYRSKESKFFVQVGVDDYAFIDADEVGHLGEVIAKAAEKVRELQGK